MKLFLVFTLLTFSNLLFAQQNLKLHGVVHSAQDDQPIDHAVCFLNENDFIGDITDSMGFFTISVPNNMVYDTLVISSLGYEKLVIPIKSFSLIDDTIHLSMKAKVLFLDEIVVSEKGYDVKSLVFDAIKKIPKNYPKRRHQLEGLYRKVSTEGSKFTYLEEAAVTVEDHDYQDFNTPPYIKVEAFRMSKEFGNTDTLMLNLVNKRKQKSIETFEISQNRLYRVFESNYLHLFQKEGTRFNYESFIKHLDDASRFELIDVIVSDKDTIYHVAFNDGALPTPPSGNTYLKINAADLAIVEFQISTGLTDNYLLDQVLVKYKKVEGRYYPYFIKTIKPRHINFEIMDDEYDIEIFWFDVVKTKKFKKLKAKESIDRFDDKGYMEKHYNPEYWEIIDTDGKYPLNQAVRSSLEREQPLKEQFQETSHK